MIDLTVDLIMLWRPCEDWPRSRVEVLFAGRESVTPLEVARCSDVPVEDRVWLLLHEPIFTPKQLRLLACTFAERVLMRERAAGREPDPRSWAAIEVSRRYAHGGATYEELTAARVASGNVSSGAADTHTFDGMTAPSAADAVACRAAWDTAWIATWAGGKERRHYEWTEQLRIITEQLEE